MSDIDKRKLTYILVITACLTVSLFCLIYPVYVIRPFRHQGVRELTVALAVLRFRAATTSACVLAGLLAAVLYWRVQPRTWRRIVAALGVTGVCLFTVLSRVNIYELMFHPIGQPSFQRIGEAKLDGDEKVIAVEVGGSARAYPIRNISYHHIVNDVVGGVPIVATY